MESSHPPIPIDQQSLVALKFLSAAEEARVIDGGSDDLDPQRIEAVFAQHARQCGIDLPHTEDPRTDAGWIRAVSVLPPL